jgi:hypothetical protein
MQGKVVIIGGTPRAGKTMLAIKLVRYGFNRISFDNLSDAIQKGFPEVVIDDWTNQEICADRQFEFFKAIIESAVNDAKIYGMNTVIDMYDFTPEYVSKLPNQNDIDVYFLAYPNKSIEEIQYTIKFFAKPVDWIAQVSEDYLGIVAKRCSQMNEKLVNQCKEYGYRLINTGVGDDRPKALERLFSKIIRQD